MSPTPSRHDTGAFRPGGTAQSARVLRAFCTAAAKEGSLPLGGTAQSARVPN